jgi:hypothetical protein
MESFFSLRIFWSRPDGGTAVTTPTYFEIKYSLRGAEKSYYLHARDMTNARAWHMAAVDAGLAEIPKYRCDKVPEVSKPKADRMGITDVAPRLMLSVASK